MNKTFYHLIRVPTYIFISMMLLNFIYMFQHDFLYNEKNLYTSAILGAIFLLFLSAWNHHFVKKGDFPKPKIILEKFSLIRKIFNIAITLFFLFLFLWGSFLFTIPRYITLMFTPQKTVITEAILEYSTNSKECKYQLKLKYYPIQTFEHTCVSKEFFYNTKKPIYVKANIKEGALGTYIGDIYLQN